MKPMKFFFLTIVFFFFASSFARPPIETTDTSENDYKISIYKSFNESDVARFKADIESMQAQNPQAFFQAVPGGQSPLSALKLVSATDDVLYPSKNFYILIGLGPDAKDEQIRRFDWNALYFIMNYLANQKFRVLVNVNATAEHLRLAAKDSKTSIILWSSHGNKEGFYDYNNQKVPYDIFKDRSKSFYQFILSACYGRIALDNHYEHKDLFTWAWSDLTDSNQLKTFLVSDKWNAFQGKK